MKKIGLFGGTFNPIHIAHLRMALEVYQNCKLDEILFVPAYLPPHKSAKGILSLEIRTKLIRLALEEFQLNPIFDISLHEEKMQGASYTYNSLQLWKEENQHTPYFILGLEDFVRLNTWHNWQELPQLTNFIVVKRAHYSIDDFHSTVQKYWPQATKNKNLYSIHSNTIEYIESSRLDISSTTIRNAFIEKKDARLLLPQSVHSYIKANQEIIQKWSEV